MDMWHGLRHKAGDKSSGQDKWSVAVDWETSDKSFSDWETRQLKGLLCIEGQHKWPVSHGLWDITRDKSRGWLRQVSKNNGQYRMSPLWIEGQDKWQVYLRLRRKKWEDYCGLRDKGQDNYGLRTRQLTLLSLRDMTSDKTILDWGTWKVETILDWGTIQVSQQVMSYIGQDKWPLDQETRPWTSLKWVNRQGKWVNCGLKDRTSDGVYYWLRDKTSDWVLCGLR